MTKRRSTKSALISSVLALVLCCSMLLGTTFAWFTDSVTSANNIIKTGTLNVEMYWSEGKDAPSDDAWKDASKGAIFNNTLWEPGYTEARHLKIANEGTLALKYQLAIIPNGDVSELADVIDVYYQSPATQIDADRANLGTKVGTLADVIRTGIHDGALTAGTAYTATIVLKMQESAGNEYQDKSIGTSFSIQLIATQMASENDSFGPDYDENAWAEGMVVHTADDLQAALNNGVTNIQLINDIVADETIVIPAPAASTYSLRSLPNAVVIDLNGNTITGTMHKNDGAVIKNAGTLVLKNGTVSSTANNGGSALVNNGTAALENVTLNGAPNADGSWPSYTLNNTGVLTATNVKLTSYHGAVASYGEGALVTLNDSEIDMAGIPGFTNHGVYTYNNGAVVINGGVYVNKAADQGATGGSVINGAVTVNGGTFSGRIENYYGTPVIQGGTFSAAINAKFIASGFSALKNADGTYTVLQGDVVATDDAALNDALAKGEDNIALGAGNFTMPATSGEVTISGTKDTVITVTTPTANKVTLNGVTVVAGSYKGIQHSDTVVFENCVLKGSQFLYANKVIIKNCVIDLTETADYIWTYSAKNVEFIDCTFNTLGKAILMYNEGPDLVTNVTVKGCTFNATESALASGAVAAAIEIASSAAVNGHYTLTTENNVVDPDFSGEWRVKNSATNNTTVNGVIYNKVEDGLYKGESNTFYVYNANGLEALNQKFADQNAGKGVTINLLADIDFTDKVWTPVDSHVDSGCYVSTINGNGHTISNFTVNGQAMFTRFAGTGDVVIKDITFDNATVTSGSINTSILTVQSYQNVLLDNVDVKNSTITGGYKVAVLIGTVYNEKESTVTATVKNCDIDNCVVKSTSYDFGTCGFIGYVAEGNNDYVVFENSTISNTTLCTTSPYYTLHAFLYYNGEDEPGCINEAEGVTVTNCVFEKLA